jgi:hypothetical protein
VRSVGLFTRLEVLIQETVKFLFSYHSYLLPQLVSCASELIAVKVDSAYYWVMHVQLESVTSPGVVVSI